MAQYQIQVLPFKARAVAFEKTIWVTGIDNLVYFYDKDGWVQYGDGISARDIAVDQEIPYIAAADGNVYKGIEENWVQVPDAPKAVKIAAGGNQIWVIGEDKKIYTWSNNQWSELPGKGTASDIAISVYTDKSGVYYTPYITGTDQRIYMHTGTEWNRSYSGKDTYRGLAISIGEDRFPVVVGTDGIVYKLKSDSGPTVFPELETGNNAGKKEGFFVKSGQALSNEIKGGQGNPATDISCYGNHITMIKADGNVYTTRTFPKPVTFIAPAAKMQRIESVKAQKVSVDHQSNKIWILGKDDKVYNLNNNTCTPVLEEYTKANKLTFSDLAAANNILYTAGKKDHILYQMSADKWEPVTGSVKVLRICCDDKDELWAVGEDHLIYHQEGKKWLSIPGIAARDLTVYHGEIFAIAGGAMIYKFHKGKWKVVSGNGKAESITNNNGRAWIVSLDNKLYYHDNQGWQAYQDVYVPVIDAEFAGNTLYIVDSFKRVYLLTQ